MGKIPLPVPEAVIKAAEKRFGIPDARKWSWTLEYPYYKAQDSKPYYHCWKWFPYKKGGLKQGNFYEDGTSTDSPSF